MSEAEMPLVITSGDEGVQLNAGTRLGFAGSGYELTGFAEAVTALQKVFGKRKIFLASVQEDDWMAEKLSSRNPNLYQETLEKLAKTQRLPYAGQLDYGDPRDLKTPDVRGHIVRPQKVHVADQIILTVGGGEQKFNLRKVVICADYVSLLPWETAKMIIMEQIKFYQQQMKKAPKFFIETDGDLSDEIKEKNKAVVKKILAE